METGEMRRDLRLIAKVAHLPRVYSRAFIVAISFFSLSLLTRNGPIYLDREDLTAREYDDPTTLLALIEARHARHAESVQARNTRLLRAPI